MFPIVRMYESGPKAQELVDALASEERVSAAMDRTYKPFSPSALAPGKDNAATVRQAVADGVLPAALAPACTAGLERGRHVVVVECRFGFSALAEKMLDAAGPVDVDRVPDYTDSSSMMFSDFLGIPTLTDRKTPLSDLLGLKLKKDPAVTSLGISRLTGSATPLSSTFRIPLLKKPDVASLGMPRLTSSATPLSSTFRIPLLKRPDIASLGFSRLLRSPTPLSSNLGFKTLTTEGRDED